MSRSPRIQDASWPEKWTPQVLDAGDRVVSVGAVLPLSFKGIGMYGVVFCDARGIGYKAARDCSAPVIVASIQDEADWLRVASTVPEIRQHIARFRHYYPRQCVIERECILGTSGRHADKRWDIHAKIREAMSRYGFGVPELKEDSYRWQPGRGWVLVDASSQIRRGNRLVAKAVQTLKGERFHGESPADVAWELRNEAGSTVAAERAQRLSDRLEALPDAQVRRR